MSTAEVAVFDFDGTIIRGDSIVSLQQYALKRRCVSAFGVIRAVCCGALYHAHFMSAATAKKYSHAFLTRMTPEARESLLRSFAQSLVDRAYPPALKKLREHHEHGDLVVICSATCSMLPRCWMLTRCCALRAGLTAACSVPTAAVKRKSAVSRSG